MTRILRGSILAAVLATGGCVTWPGYGPSWDSGSYYERSYQSYGGVYEKRYGGYPYDYDYGLRYGRPFYTTYGAWPPGYYYDPRFHGGARPVTPSRPPVMQPPPEDPVAEPAPRPPRLGPRTPRPGQPVYRAVPKSGPVARPAPPPPVDRDPPSSRRPHHSIPQ